MLVDSSEPADAPDLIAEGSLVELIERCRTDVVSAVLDALVPVSRSAAVPIWSVSLLLQPTSATNSAVANKDFFIIVFLNLLKRMNRL